MQTSITSRPSIPPRSVSRQALPPSAVGDLLLQAVQSGLPLRLALHAGGAVLVREARFSRLVFDGHRLRAEAGADGLCLDEIHPADAWCIAEAGRAGLRHRVELDGGDWRLEIGECELPGRPESCTWRQLVASLAEGVVHG